MAKEQKRRVLTDHVKVGRTFIPPMRQFKMEGMSLSKRIIPELFWIAMLNDYYGWRKGADLSLRLAQAASQATETPSSEVKAKLEKPPKKWFAVASSFTTLTPEEKANLVSQLKLALQWEFFVDALAPLVAFYPNCPLNFLFEGAALLSNQADLEHLKKVLTELFDKYSKPFVAMAANAIYIGFGTNKLNVVGTSSLARDFPAVEDYPDTERSRASAASIRATMYGMFHQVPQEWETYFWNRGLELEPCDYEGVVSDDRKKLY